MQPFSGRHGRFTHAFVPRPIVPGTTITTDTPVTVTATTTTAASASPVGATVVTAPTRANLAVFGASSAPSSDPHGAMADAATSTTTTCSRSSCEHVATTTTESKSPTQHPLSTSASLPAPPTPSNWMVRAASLSGGSPATLSALGAGTNHDSASSFNSSAGNPTLSPLLHPHSTHNNTNSSSNINSTCSNTAGHDWAGETDATGSADPTFFLMERASGRKRTPRSVAVGGPANGSGNTSGDGDSLTTPSSTRLIFSRRTSTGGGLNEASDDALRGSPTRLIVLLAADGASEEEAARSHGEAHARGEAQSTLHSSRSRCSGTGTTTTRTSSPMATALPAVAIVMNDVPATDLTVRSSSTSFKTPVPVPASATMRSASASDSTAATIVGGSRRTRSGSNGRHAHEEATNTAAPTQPSAVSTSTATTTAAAAGAAVAVSRPPAGPLMPLETPTHFSAPLTSVTSSGRELRSPTVFTSQHFASAVELPSWPHYSKASSCTSLADLGNDEAPVPQTDNNNSSDGTQGTHRNETAGACVPHGAAASFTTFPVVSVGSPLHPAAASATVHPHDCPSAPVNLTEPQAVAPSMCAPRMDAWAAAPLPTVAAQRSGSTSSSSSSSGAGAHRTGHHHHSHSHHRAAAAGATATTATQATVVPVFSSMETHPASPSTEQTHASGNFLSYHPNFSRTFFSRFGVSSATVTPTDDAARDTAKGAATATTTSATAGAPPLPPPPPPTSPIPSPIIRAAVSNACGSAASSTNARVTPTFSNGNLTGLSSGRATPANGRQFGSLSPLPPPPPPPPSPLPDKRDGKQQQQQQQEQLRSVSIHGSSSTPPSEHHSLPRHGMQTSARGTAATVASAVGGEDTVRGSPSSTPDERGGVEAMIGGMPMMVLPPAALRPRPEGGAPISSGVTTPTTADPPVAHAYPHNQQQQQHHHHHHSRLRGSSLGSNGGGVAHPTPFAKSHLAGPSTPPVAAQSREFLYTSSSSFFTSTPQTLTSTTSDPMLLSFSSANLAAPMTSNGSSNTNTSNYCALNQGGGGSGNAAHSSPAGGASPATTEGFVMKPDAETVLSLPRGKVPRMPGCSMRDWTAHLAAKEAANRREQQQRPQHASSTSASSGGTTPAFSSPVNQHPPGSRAGLPRMTAQEVAKHNSPDDLWMVIRNVVYDCTEFQRFHPGGEKLLLACAGRDATEVYDRFHAWVSCESFMGPYAVGILAPPAPH